MLSHEQMFPRPRITLFPKLIREVHYNICFFFLLDTEIAKLSIKCGDLSISKARKCQIHKQFMNEYRLSTIKNDYLLVSLKNSQKLRKQWLIFPW